MSYRNMLQHDVAAVQAEMRGTIINLRQQKSHTRNSFKSGTGARGQAGRLAGLEIPFSKNVAHGSTALDVLNGSTSFGRYIPSSTDKMYVGLAQTGFSVEWEYFHQKDAAAGNLPKTRFEQRDEVMQTYLQEQNWYSISKGLGTVAVVSAGVASPGGTITLAYDNTARDRSKGSIRLAVSLSTTAGQRVEYQSYNPSTDALTATFYLTSKPNATQAVVVITDAGTIGANDVIVKSGHYKKVSYGIGYHSDSSNRFYQGVDTTLYPFLNARYINGGAVQLNPTMIDAAKGSSETLANDQAARKNRIAHMTIANYKMLGAFGYTLRQYNAEKGDAKTTYGVPQMFEDEDTIFCLDADYEEAFVDIRDRSSFFEYTQAELAEVSGGPQDWVGTATIGSTEKYQNYGESRNLAWDGRGDDGKGKSGSANSTTYIGNIAFPATTQVAEGKSLV